MTQPINQELDEKEWYTTQEVADFFGVDPKTVGRWAAKKKFEAKGIRIVLTPGGHRRYNREDIHRIYDDQQDPAHD